MRVEHHDLVLAFVESHIERFDDFHKKRKKYAVDPETTTTRRTDYTEGPGNPATVLPSETHHLTILGSKQKPMTIEELLKNTSANTAFTSFCSRVSLVIQALSSEPADTIVVNDSHQVLSLVSLMPCFIIQI